MTTYKRLPIDAATIEQMKISTPEIYNDMVTKFGEENVISNLLIDAVVLTEDKKIVLGQGNNPIHITRELINKAKKVNNSLWNVYIKEPIHRLKASLSNGDETLGYTPIILQHAQNYNKVQSRQGYVLGGSYHTMDLDGKLHLMCKEVLISPEAKYMYLQGLYREQSPTIDKNSGAISEVSFVNIPAQMTNISLEANDITNTTISANKENWEAKIAEAKQIDHQAKQDYKIKQKEARATALVTTLMKRGVITSSKRTKYKELFVSLSAPDDELVANALMDVKQSPLNNKPRQVFLQGNLYMNKSKEERFLEFSKENSSKYSSGADLTAAFDKFEAEAKVSLAAGAGDITDPMGDIVGKLTSMKEAGSLTDEHKATLSAFCGHATASLTGSDVGMPGTGEPTDAGTGIGTPNNTSLAAPEPVPASNLVDVLQAGFNAEKSRADKAEAENAELRTKLNTIKQSIGV